MAGLGCCAAGWWTVLLWSLAGSGGTGVGTWSPASGSVLRFFAISFAGAGCLLSSVRGVCGRGRTCIGDRCCTARGRSRGIAPVELLLRLSMRLAMTVAAAVAEFAAAVIREVVIDVSTLVGCAAFVLVHTRVAGAA